MSTGRADPHVLEPGHAPTPFTAEEIRRGCPPGRTIRMLVEIEGVEPAYRVNRFVGCDEAGTTLERAFRKLKLTSDDGCGRHFTSRSRDFLRS